MPVPPSGDSSIDHGGGCQPIAWDWQGMPLNWQIVGRTEAERSSQCFEDRNDAFGRCLTNFTFPAYIYLRFFTPKIWHFLISRGKNFGGVFFDVFWKLEQDSEKISPIHWVPIQIPDWWALLVHNCIYFLRRFRTWLTSLARTRIKLLRNPCFHQKPYKLIVYIVFCRKNAKLMLPCDAEHASRRVDLNVNSARLEIKAEPLTRSWQELGSEHASDAAAHQTWTYLCTFKLSCATGSTPMTICMLSMYLVFLNIFLDLFEIEYVW